MSWCQVTQRERYEYVYSTKCDLDEFKHTQIFNVVEPEIDLTHKHAYIFSFRLCYQTFFLKEFSTFKDEK